ncbi:hypothetical protein [Terriglobus sp.]|uniref:hypothetical protein n=1 Tax=Terriglobus sp. TaxID=1889013 RepID=UPI003B00C587
MSKRQQRLLLACIGGLGGLLVDNCLVGSRLAFGQMMLCTVLVFGIVGIQAGKTLLRPRQAGVALALIVLHFLMLVRYAAWFPFTNMIVGILGAGAEAIVLIFLYARIGQAVDPKGPYGLTSCRNREETRASRAFQMTHCRLVLYPSRHK